jgi:hypothetical protein
VLFSKTNKNRQKRNKKHYSPKRRHTLARENLSPSRKLQPWTWTSQNP